MSIRSGFRRCPFYVYTHCAGTMPKWRAAVADVLRGSRLGNAGGELNGFFVAVALARDGTGRGGTPPLQREHKTKETLRGRNINQSIGNVGRSVGHSRSCFCFAGCRVNGLSSKLTVDWVGREIDAGRKRGAAVGASINLKMITNFSFKTRPGRCLNERHKKYTARALNCHAFQNQERREVT